MGSMPARAAGPPGCSFGKYSVRKPRSGAVIVAATPHATARPTAATNNRRSRGLEMLFRLIADISEDSVHPLSQLVGSKRFGEEAGRPPQSREREQAGRMARHHDDAHRFVRAREDV